MVQMHSKCDGQFFFPKQTHHIIGNLVLLASQFWSLGNLLSLQMSWELLTWQMKVTMNIPYQGK